MPRGRRPYPVLKFLILIFIFISTPAYPSLPAFIKNFLLKILKFLFPDLGLFQDSPKGSLGNVAWMHRHVGLSAVLMSQHQMGATVATNLETSLQ